jgi:hypothetical protein
MATLYDLMMQKRGLGTPLLRNTDAYAGGTPGFNEFSGGNTIMPGTPMPQPMPLPQPTGPLTGAPPGTPPPGAVPPPAGAPTTPTGAPTPMQGMPNSFGTPTAGTNGYDFGTGTDPGDFWRNITLGNEGLYSNATKNYVGGPGNGWNPQAAMNGYLATQGGPDNAIGFGAWMTGSPNYVARFGPPPPPGTTFEQFRQGIGLGGKAVGTPTLYTPPPGAPGSPGHPVGGAPVPPPTGNPIAPGSGAAPGLPHGDPLPGGDVAGGFGNLGGPDAYALDPNKYLNPLMDYALATGTKAINNSAAASGNLMSGNTLRELMAYGTGLGANNWNNAVGTATQQQGFHAGLDSADRAFGYNAAVGDRQFGYDAANNDRQFGYNAALGDRAFNTQRDEFLAQLGMSGAQGASGLDQTLASAIAQNLATQGGINANGTIGQNNAITGSISQIIQALQSGRTLNDIMGRISPTPTPTPTPTGGP